MGNERIESLLERLVQLQRVQVYPVARELLRDAFVRDDELQAKRIRVYACLDGALQADVADKAGVSQSSVSTWSSEWKRVGLVTEGGQAVFDIFDFFPEWEEQV